MNNKYWNEPIISVVMSVYNGADYLREAIESILNQSFNNFEFIIINDGSTDKSLEIIKSYEDERIVIVDQQNTGLAKALNNGIKIARGKYIARMDADDISMFQRLQLQLIFLEKHPEVVVVGGNAEIIDKDGNYIYNSNQLLEWNEIENNLPQTPFFHSSTMYRKSGFEEVDGYPDIYRIEDVIFFNRLSKVGQLRNLKDVLIKYRLTPSAVTAKASRKDGIRIKSIILEIIKGDITAEQKAELKALTISRDSEWRKYMYHIHLAKKYLWNNFRPKLARENILKAIRFRPWSLEFFFLLVLSFIPEQAIIFIHTRIKGH